MPLVQYILATCYTITSASISRHIYLHLLALSKLHTLQYIVQLRVFQRFRKTWRLHEKVKKNQDNNDYSYIHWTFSY